MERKFKQPHSWGKSRQFHRAGCENDFLGLGRRVLSAATGRVRVGCISDLGHISYLVICAQAIVSERRFEAGRQLERGDHSDPLARNQVGVRIMSIGVEIAIIVLLALVNGVLAMSEIAYVSASRTRLQISSRKGDKKAAAALRLIDSPTRLLSTVQVGITLIGIMAGAFGGATLAEELGLWLAKFPSIAE
ncbi:MAG: DUF21 domain-containing protein, partial [Acidobacteria bacterium]